MSKKSSSSKASRTSKKSTSKASAKPTTRTAATTAVTPASEQPTEQPAKSKKSLPSFEKFLPYLLVGGGIIGLICSFIISYDKVQLLKNPSFSPNCDLNPIISCGSVMSSKQGEAFGFPNPWIGLVSFGVLITIGMALFALYNRQPARTFRRWFWLGLQAGTVLGVLFVHWLFFQSVFRIHALCPYCMVVWTVTITTFWYTLLFNIETGVIKLPANWQTGSNFIRRHHLDILLVWFLAIFVIIMHHFWYYFGKHLGF